MLYNSLLLQSSLALSTALPKYVVNITHKIIQTNKNHITWTAIDPSFIIFRLCSRTEKWFSFDCSMANSMLHRLKD